MNLEKMLTSYTEKEKEMNWSGTFKKYLELVKDIPSLAKTSHQRVYDMIMEAGVREENGIKKYAFFEKELVGMDSVIQTLMDEYFKPAAMGLDVKKRMLLMMGPVSSGKSTIATLIKRGMEAYSKTEKGAVYAIKDCPMQSDPLWMIPDELRPLFEKELGVKITGHLNPKTKWMIEEKYKGDFLSVEVERIFLSEQERKGIGTFSPSDPKSQDIADLIGSIDFSSIQEFGSESDPRAFRFDGELNISNRGVIEFQEILKCDEKFLWHLLSLTQEGNFKAGRFALIDADEMILAHTNETEYRSFMLNDKNEALRSRMFVVHVPYNLKASDEEKVLKKSLEKNGVDSKAFDSLALQTLAEFVVMTRVNEYADADITFKRMKALEEGEKPLHEEGMHGIDLRFIFNRLSYLAANHEKTIDGFLLLDEIEKGFYQHPSIKKEKLEKYKGYIHLLKEELNKKIQEEIKGLLLEGQEANNMMNHYLEQLNKSMKNEQYNEEFMRSLEEEIGISPNTKKAFREEIYIRVNAYQRKGKKFTYDSHSTLKKAIDRKMLKSLRELIEIDQERLKKVSNTYAEIKKMEFEVAYKLVKKATESITKTA